MDIRTPFPTNRTFKWEHSTFTYEDAATLMLTLMKQGGTVARRDAYQFAADRIRQRDHDDMTSTEISGAEVKRILIDAARDAQWWDRRPPYFKKPEPAPPGQKTCFVCATPKPTEEFLTTPTPAQAKRYGWRADTTQKVPTHVCAECRRKRADAKAKKRARTRPRRDVRIDNAAMQERMFQYERVRAQIALHLGRVSGTLAQAFKTINGMDDQGEPLVIKEYQFSSKEREEFFLLKRDMLLIARERLRALLGEAADGQPAPIPHRWGMLLTKAEQQKLQDMHEEAFRTARREPQLW